MAEPDEFTPRERGLLIGAKVAELVARGELELDGATAAEQLAALAADPPQVSDGLRVWLMDDCGMAERLAASDDPDAKRAFWRGFAHGVRAWMGEPPPHGPVAPTPDG
jgi:hypothetical protein